MSLSEETVAEIERLRNLYPQSRSAVLPSLWAVQHECGYVNDDGMREVARVLELAPSEVQAVSTFYSMYFDKPEGKHYVIVCKNVSCALRGSDEIIAHMEKSLGCASGETTKDGEFSWESTVECLGACGGAPAMQVDHHTFEDLTPKRVDDLLAGIRGGKTNEKKSAGDDAKPGGSVKKPRPRRAKIKTEDIDG